MTDNSGILAAADRYEESKHDLVYPNDQLGTLAWQEDLKVLADAYLTHIDAQKNFEAERNEPFDDDWLRSLDGVPDDAHDGTLYFSIWQEGEHTRPQKGFTEFVHLYITTDGEYGFEEYDQAGGTVAIITVGVVKTKGDVLDLLKGLGIKTDSRTLSKA